MHTTHKYCLMSTIAVTGREVLVIAGMPEELQEGRKTEKTDLGF